MDKWCDHIIWRSGREALVLHWRKVLSALVAAASVMAMTAFFICTPPAGRGQPVPPCEATASPNTDIPDSCPWHLVMSDLTHRLRLLEMAFKEQVVAREVIAAEVTNQSYTNLELEKRLEEFVSAIKQLSFKLDSLKEQLTELSSRLYSDECLGFLVVVFVVVQIILAVRTKIQDKQSQALKAPSNQAHNGATVMSIPRSLSNDSVSNPCMSSKQSPGLKQDACTVTFNTATKEQHSALIDLLLAHLTDGLKCPAKQSHTIDSQAALKECPRARAYVVFVDGRGLNPEDQADQNGGSRDALESDNRLKRQQDQNGGSRDGLELDNKLKRQQNLNGGSRDGLESDNRLKGQQDLNGGSRDGLESDNRLKGQQDLNGGSREGLESDNRLKGQQDLNFKLASLRLLNLSSGVVILVLTKDPGSQQLPSHNLYNTNLPLIQSNDILQELASNGRLFTIWNEFSSNQLSHIKKIGRSIFSLKGK